MAYPPSSPFFQQPKPSILLWWGNWVVLGYAALLWIGFQAWIMLYEEPGLRRRFGEQYSAYCRRVPRWFGVSRGSQE